MTASLFAMLLSGVISKKILNLFGAEIDEQKIT